MNAIQLFPFSEYWWLYGVFILFVFGMLLLDLGVFNRKAHQISFKESAIWSAVWISLAMLFNLVLYQYTTWKFGQDPRLLAIANFQPLVAAKQVSLEFLAGFILEKALAVDNLFIFVVIFKFFAIPAQYQHRILFYGILGALIFRSIFIALGSVLMQYEAVVILFGAFLIFTGVKMVVSQEKEIDPKNNKLILILQRIFRVTPEMDGPHFFIRKKHLLYATPLFACLIFIELSDIVFALDSVPAIFAITKEPLIVFTSNIFAILGLRSLYFMLAGVMDKFHLLKYGLALVLMFVGLKMVWLNHFFDGKFPIGISLGIIGGVLAVSILLSVLIPQKKVDLE